MAASPARRAVPRVFISYSHDSEEHRTAVLDLAQRLRGVGLDVQIDRYVTSPREGWPRWMLAQVERAEFVLVVCTPTYRRRFDGKERRGKGLGATFEGLLALQLFYEAGAANKKFVPVLFPGAVAARAIPLPLRPFTHFRVPAQFDDLVDHLHSREAVQPAPLAVPAAGGRRPSVRSEGARDVSVGREELLEQLLLSLFSDAEFRRWIARDPECAAISAKLPGAAASWEDLVNAALEAMVHHGLVDAGFFERLLRKFPRRDDDVRRVAAVWAVVLDAEKAPRNAAATKPSTSVTGPRKTKKTGAKKNPRKKTTSAARSRASATSVVYGGIVMGKGAKIGGHAAGGDLVIHQTTAPEVTPKKRRARS